jgi:hypothetical protein
LTDARKSSKRKVGRNQISFFLTTDIRGASVDAYDPPELRRVFMPYSTKHPLVIGVTGPIGSGVSTVSLVLEDMGFVRRKVSETIRAHIAAAETPNGTNDTVSKSLQDIGNEMSRTKGSHYWIEQTLKGIPEGSDIPLAARSELFAGPWAR